MPSSHAVPLLSRHGRGELERRLPSISSLCSGLSTIFVLLFFVEASSQQKDPVQNFCRRFGHQTAVIDRKLYIDGGLINWNPIPSYPTNYSNTWLLYQDLDHNSPDGMPLLYANLSKNASIPDVSGGILWADEVNKRFYLFGGEYYQSAPTAFNLYSYDAINNWWDSFGPPQQTSISSVSYGAGVAVSDRGVGYYYGGWLSNNSVPGWSGDPIATSGLIRYNMDSNTWTNNTGPDSMRRAEGSMNYIPAGDGGMLIYFGGVTDPYVNGTVVGQPMDQVFIYDILSNKWYTQNTTGATPQMRRRFCSGVAWAPDQSSYNIYLYGGAGMPPETAGYDDVYILSIPTFTWIKMYPTDGNVTGQYPHHSLSCNVVSGAQMLIIGGTFPLTDDCDAAPQWGTHNLDMGEQNANKVPWQLFAPNLTTYAVPDPILSVVGGQATGGATKTAPANGFDNVDLDVLMTRKASVAARTPTRAIPGATGTSDSGPALSTGAIVGIAVGGGVALILVLGFCCFFIRRHRRKNRAYPAPNPHASPGGGSAGFFGGHPSGGSPYSPYSSHTPSSPYPTSPYGRRPSPGYHHQQQPSELPATGTNLWTPTGAGSYEMGTGGGGSPPPHHAIAHDYVDQPKYDDQGRPWMPQVSMMEAPRVQDPLYPPHRGFARTASGGGGETGGRFGLAPPGSPPMRRAQTPQELSSEPRLDAGWPGGESGASGATEGSSSNGGTGSGTGTGTGSGGSPGRRHETFYHR